MGNVCTAFCIDTLSVSPSDPLIVRTQASMKLQRRRPNTPGRSSANRQSLFVEIHCDGSLAGTRYFVTMPTTRYEDDFERFLYNSAAGRWNCHQRSASPGKLA